MERGYFQWARSGKLRIKPADSRRLHDQPGPASRMLQIVQREYGRKFPIAAWNCVEAERVVDFLFKTIHVRMRSAVWRANPQTHPDHGLMSKPKKSSATNKRRQKGNGQVRLRTEQNVPKEARDQPAGTHVISPYEAASSQSSARRKPQRDDGERKRMLWERKQAELEARRVAAQSRRTEENAARHRTMRIVRSVTGTVMAVLLCALVWYFAQGGIHFDAPA